MDNKTITKVIKQQWDYNILYTHIIYDEKYNYIASGDLIERLDSLMIERVYVDPKYRGKGYGKEIVKLLLGNCDRSQIKEIYLKVHYDNQIAQQMYKKLGFTFSSFENQYIWMQLIKK